MYAKPKESKIHTARANRGIAMSRIMRENVYASLVFKMMPFENVQLKRLGSPETKNLHGYWTNYNIYH